MRTIYAQYCVNWSCPYITGERTIRNLSVAFRQLITYYIHGGPTVTLVLHVCHI